MPPKKDLEGPTYRELAATAKASVRTVVARDPRGVPVEFALKEDLLPIVKKAGLDTRDLTWTSGGRAASGSMADADKARRRAAAGKRAATLAVMGAVVAAAEKKVPGVNVWPFLAKLLQGLVGHDAGLEILKRRGIDTKRATGVYSDAVDAKFRKLLGGMNESQARGLAIELAASSGTFSFGEWAGKDLSQALKAAAAFYGVNVAKISGTARSALRAEKKTKRAKAPKKGARKCAPRA